MITKENFLSQIREKYPAYNEVEDETLYNSLIEKYPVYKDQIIEPEPLEATDNDLYDGSADDLLQKELEKIDAEESEQSETFYNQSSAQTLDAPVQEPGDISIEPDLEQDIDTQGVVQDNVKDEPESPFKLDLDISKVPDAPIAAFKTSDNQLEGYYKDLLSKGVLRKAGTDEDVTLEEYKDLVKKDESDKFRSKLTDLKVREENSYIVDERGKEYSGKVIDVLDNGNVVFQRRNGNKLTLREDKVAYTVSLEDEIASRAENWDSVSSQYPTYQNLPENFQTTLVNDVVEGNFDSFMDAYISNYPVSEKEVYRDSKKLYKLKGIPDTKENRKTLESIFKDYGEEAQYTSEDNFLLADVTDIRENVRLNIKFKLGKAIGGAYIAPEKQKIFGTESVKDVGASAINPEIIQEGYMLFDAIKKQSPGYLLLKTSKEEMEDNLNSLHTNILSEKNIGDIDISYLEDKLPKSYKEFQSNPHKFDDFLENAKKVYYEKGPAELEFATYHQDGSVSYDGTFILEKKAGEGFYNSFTKSVNPLIMMGGSKEDGDNLIKDLIKVQVEANRTTLLKGLQLREIWGGGSGPLVGGQGITIRDLNHYFDASTSIPFGSKNIDFEIKGYGGLVGIPLDENPDNYDFSFRPNDAEAYKKAFIPATETDVSFLDVYQAFAIGVTSIPTAILQAGSMAISSISGGFYGASQATLGSLINWETPWKGYRDRWGDTMNAYSQPYFKADKAGNAVMEGAFIPITAGIHAVEWTGDKISGAGWDLTGKTFKVAGTAGVIFYTGGKVYAPLGQSAKTFLYNKPKVSGKNSFQAGVETFVDGVYSAKPFHNLYTAGQVRAKQSWNKYSHKLMKRKWVQDIGNKFGFDFRKNFQMQPYGRKGPVKSYLDKTDALGADFADLTVNVPYKSPVKFQLWPGKISVPKIRKNKETGKTEFYIDKNFEFKSRELGVRVPKKRINKETGKAEWYTEKRPFFKTVNPDWVALTNNVSGILPTMIADLQTLNFKEFSGKWKPIFKDLNIRVSEVNFRKWSREVYKTPEFKESLNKGWGDFIEQKRLSETNPTKFTEIYENGGKGNKGLDITADILNDNTIVKVVPGKDKKTDLVIENRITGESKAQTYSNPQEAGLALVELHGSVSTHAEIFRAEVEKAYLKELDDFVVSPEKTEFILRHNNSIVTPDKNLDRVSLTTVRVPEQNTSAINDIVSDIKYKEADLFNKNPENTVITIKKADKGVDISVEVLTPKSNRQLSIDFAEKNNSSLTNSDEGVIVKPKAGNVEYLAQSAELLRAANDLIKGNPTALNKPTSFERVYKYKENIDSEILKIEREQKTLKGMIKKVKNPAEKKELLGHIEDLNSTAKALYENKITLEEAMANNQIPIEKLYHGSKTTKEITEIDFDVNKVSPKVVDTSPIELVQQLAPAFWKKLMKTKDYKDYKWDMATRVLKGEILKNPDLYAGSDYIMFRRSDAPKIKVPEYFNIKDGRYYSPLNDVANLYSITSGRKGYPGNVPEIDARYSVTAPKPKKAPVKKEEVVLTDVLGRTYTAKDAYNQRLAEWLERNPGKTEKDYLGVAASNKRVWEIQKREDYAKNSGKLLKKQYLKDGFSLSQIVKSKSSKPQLEGDVDRFFRTLYGQLHDAYVAKKLARTSKEKANAEAVIKELESLILEIQKKEALTVKKTTAKKRKDLAPDFTPKPKPTKKVTQRDWAKGGKAKLGVALPGQKIGKEYSLDKIPDTVLKNLLKTYLKNEANIRAGKEGKGAYESLSKIEFELARREELGVTYIGEVGKAEPFKPKPKKAPAKRLSKQELAALSPDGKIAYYRKIREDLINKVQDKLTQKELDSVGADFLDPKINKKITPAEASLIKNIDKQINQITRESKKLKEEGELFTWTRRGVGNQKIIEKFPIETVERIKALEPLEQKVEIFKEKMKVAKPNTTEYFEFKNELRKAREEHDAFYNKDLKKMVASLQNTSKQLKNDLKQSIDGKIKLTKSEQDIKRKTIKSAEKLEKHLTKVIKDKLTLSEIMDFKAELIPGLSKLLSAIDLKTQIAKLRKTEPTYNLEEIDYLVNSSGTSIPGFDKDFGNLVTKSKNQAYKKAFDIVNKFEAALNEKMRFVHTLNEKVPSIQDSWDIITYIENKSLPKNKRVGNRFIEGDDVKSLNKRINMSSQERMSNFKKLVSKTPYVNKIFENPVKLKDIANQYEKVIEKTRKDINIELEKLSPGEYINFIENYIPHFWDFKGKDFINVISKWTKTSPSLKKRKIPTYSEGIEFGLTPKIENLADIYKKYIESNYIMVRNRALLHQLEGLRDVNNEPILMSKDALNRTISVREKQIEIAKKEGISEEFIKTLEENLKDYSFKNYKSVTNEFVWRVFAKNKDGSKMIKKDPIYIHKDFAPIITPFLGNTNQISLLGRIYDQVNSFSKGIFFSFSFFHALSLGETGVMQMAFRGKGFGRINPLRGVALILERHPITGKRMLIKSPRKLGREILENSEHSKDMIAHGMPRDNKSVDFAKDALYDMTQRFTRWRTHKKELTVPIINKTVKFPKMLKKVLWPLDLAGKAFGKYQKAYSNLLWDRVHQGGKAFAYHEQVSKIMKRHPELDPYMVKTLVAEALNNQSGGQSKFKIPNTRMNKVWNSPKFQKWAGRLMLAPDWTWSALNQLYSLIRVFRRKSPITRFYGDPKGVRKISRATYGRYWGTGLFGLFTGLKLLDYILHVSSGGSDEDFINNKLVPDKPMDFFDLDVTGVQKEFYKLASNIEIGGVPLLSKETADRWTSDLNYRKQTVRFGKQFKESINPITPLANAFVGGALYGNDIGREVSDFSKRQSETFTRKLAPLVQNTYEFFVGYTTSGYKLPESYLDEPGVLESASYKIKRNLIDFITPVSLRDGNTQFMNSLPVGQVMSESKARERIGRLLSIYSDVDQQYDIMGEYGKPFTNISYPDFVSNLDNLMPELLTEIKKNNPGLDVGKLYDQAINQKINSLLGEFWTIYNPRPLGKLKPFKSVDAKKLVKLSLELGRLHYTGERLHASLDRKGQKMGFSVGYGADEYKEYMEFADSLINNFPYKELTAPIYFKDKTELQIWKDDMVDSVWYKPKFNYKKQPWE